MCSHPLPSTGDERIDAQVLRVVAQAAALAGLDVEEYVRLAVLEYTRDDSRAAAADGYLAEVATALVAAAADTRQVLSWRWELPVAGRAPARARMLARTAMAGHGLDGQGDVCLLLLSELVTNAVRYGEAPVTVRLVLRAGELLCAVGDGSSTAPRPYLPQADAEGGRGLSLLAQLSTTCGWTLTETGKAVWFTQRLGIAPASAPADAPPWEAFHQSPLPTALRVIPA